MTPEDLSAISKIFDDPHPSKIMSKLNDMGREQRKELAENLFEVMKKVYGTLLEPSIRETFLKIHLNMKKMFFKHLFHIDHNLKSDRQAWIPKIKRLRQIDLFSDTSDFDLLNIAENLEEVDLQANIPFLVQYEEVKGVYLLKDSANVFEFNSVVPVIARSGIFGETACATGERESSITVKPVTNCKALFITRENFVKLIRSVPGLQEKVFQSIVERSKQGSIRAEEQRKLTQEILDNIGQGSFSIDVAGEIGENYTALAIDYLGTENLVGIPFADLAFRNDRAVLRNYYRALHMLFSGIEFNHNVVLDLLPNEVSINERDFKLQYSFVQDGAGNVMSVFVRMEDITLQLELARKEEQEIVITSKMQSNVGGFMDMLEDIQKSYERISQFNEKYLVNIQQPENQVINEMMRTLHGSKGLSGQFELVKLKTVIHELEDWFLSIEKDGIEKHAESFQKLLSTFERELEYALSFKENLGEGIIQILKGVSFDLDQFGLLEEASIKGDLDAIRSIVLSKNSVSAEQIISNWKGDALRLAERLQKTVDVQISVEKDLTVSKELAKKLNVDLAHLYRNCVDHGIETARLRFEAGKAEQGIISIVIVKEQENLVIDIMDDGSGIDNQKIVQLALANSNLDQQAVQKYIDDDEHWRILFLPGFSSAEKVTDVSGRGVGMDAVLKTIESVSGSINVVSEYGNGTTVRIQIPLQPF